MHERHFHHRWMQMCRGTILPKPEVYGYQRESLSLTPVC